jgi:hypothetical protein
MNLAHVHLILNHVPIFTIPVSFIFFIYSLRKKNEDLKRFSLFVLLLTALSVIPVYFTGEPAEKLIEDLPGVNEKNIENHEEAAEVALILTLASGGLALLALVFPKNEKLNHYLPRILFITTLAATVSLGYTAGLGGKVRHSEEIGDGKN